MSLWMAIKPIVLVIVGICLGSALYYFTIGRRK